MLKKANFRTKLLMTIIPVVVLSVGALGIVTYLIAANAVSAVQFQSLEQIVQKTVFEMDLWVADRERDAVILAENPSFSTALQSNNVKKVEPLLETIHKQSPIYENVFLADPSGKLLVDSIGGKSVGVDIGKIEGYKDNVAHAQRGETWVDDVRKSPATGRPVVLVTAPIRVQGQTIGILGTPVELNNFSDVFILGSKIGQTGYLYII